MRKLSLLLLAIFSGVALAQSPSQHKSGLQLSGGASVMLGLESGDASQDGAVSAGALGVYVESLHYRFHPGLEVRGEAGNGVIGTLTGPRVSYWYGPFAFYAAALFGPQHFESSTELPNYSFTTQDVEGITSKGVLGVDIIQPQHPHVGMRLEYSQGTFTGAPNARPKTVLAGIIIRFP
jgi:hypothetical protein